MLDVFTGLAYHHLTDRHGRPAHTSHASPPKYRPRAGSARHPAQHLHSLNRLPAAIGRRDVGAPAVFATLFHRAFVQVLHWLRRSSYRASIRRAFASRQFSIVRRFPLAACTQNLAALSISATRMPKVRRVTSGIYDRDPEHVIVTHDGLNFWVGCKIDAKPGQPLQLIEISLHGFDCPERLPILLSRIDAPDQKRSSGFSAKRTSMHPSRGPLPVLLINTPGVEARQPHARGWLG